MKRIKKGMNPKLIAKIVRTKFASTTRIRARRQIVNEAGLTLKSVEAAGAEAAKPVKVPSMLGVDEDMRDWSLLMILEHNALANAAITRTMKSLGEGEVFESTVNPKTDFMPGVDPGREQVALFEASVESHLQALDALGNLRKTESLKHPVFGELNAHGWNCVFGFHLMLHRKQAEVIVRILKQGE